MLTIASEPELKSCFREIDREEVELFHDLAFPLVVDGALAWSLGPRAFLLFRDRAHARPRGIVFHRNPGAIPDAVAMCEWCHAVRGHGGVKLMSVRTDERRRLGLYLCSGLECVRPTDTPPSPDDLREGLDATERSQRALRRIADFAARRLF